MLNVNITNALSLQKKLKILAMPTGQRRRLTKKMAQQIRLAARQRIQQQENIDGRAFAKRQGKSRRKMLRGLKKLMKTMGDEKKARVYFADAKVGKIAAEHQHGKRTRHIMRRGVGASKLAHYDDPATRRQARALLVAGFKRPRGEGQKGYARASQRWIMNNLSIGKAGATLKAIGGSRRKKTWEIVLPARAFLGLTEAEITRLINFVFDSTVSQMKRAA